MARIDTTKVRIPREVFTEIFGTLATYFRAKTSAIIDDQYYERIKFFPEDALRFAEKRLVDERRPTAGNFPRPNGLANLCHMWLDNNPDIKHRMTVYNSPDDHDYPYQFLEEGFSVLMGKGLQRFGQFLRMRRMPRNDVIRVLCKAAVCLPESDLKSEVEMAIDRMGTTAPYVTNDQIQDVILSVNRN